MKLHVLVVLGLALASTGSPARSELTPTQRVELREQLNSLADAFGNGDAAKAVKAAAVLQRWDFHHAPALPLNWLCQRARDLAEDDFDPESEEVLRFIAAVRGMGADFTDAVVPSRDTSAARRTLAEVLSAAEYRTQTSDSGDWWRRTLTRFLFWLDDMLRRLMGTESAARFATLVHYIVLALLLFPLISLVVYLIWKQIQSREAPSPVATARSLDTLDTADVHLARARGLFQRGEFGESLKQYHLAVLAHLEQCGIVVCDRARTNWEYFAQVQRKTDSAASLALLRQLNLVYDKAVFGMQPCNAVLVEDFSLTVDKFLAAMNPLSASPPSP